MEIPTVPDLLTTQLPTSPDINTAYTFARLTREILESAQPAHTTSEPPIWLIFVNGLGLPQAFWQPTISILKSTLPSDLQRLIYTTTYDRAYQGLSRPIAASASNKTTKTSSGNTPAAAPPTQPPPPAGPIHSPITSVTEVHSLLNHLVTNNPSLSSAIKILVSHSIGVPLSRLFIQSHPGQVSALLAIDSNLANTDLSALIPDPTSSNFSPDRDLPSDTTLEQLAWSRGNYAKIFAPGAPNAEGLDRREFLTRLPFSDQPLLPGPRRDRETEHRGHHKDGILVLKVIAHDPASFAQEGTKICTEGLTKAYIEPAWQRYNRGLLRLDGSGEGRDDGWEEDDSRDGEIVVAEGAGHFVQRDRPDVIAREIWGLINSIHVGKSE